VNFHVATDRLNKLTVVSGIKLAKKSDGLVVIDSYAGISAIEADWRDLEIKNGILAHVFQSFDWVNAWCKTHLDPEQNDKLQVYAGYNNNALVFLFPLLLTSHHGVKTLQWITEPLGQYGDALCAEGQDCASWLKLSFAAIQTSKIAQLLRLRHIRKDSLIEEFANQHMVDSKYDERAPYLDLTAFKTDADYDARYTSAQRKRRKKIRKSLEESGPVTFNILKSVTESDSAIDQAILEKNAWLWDRGRYNRIMGCSRHIEFLKALARSQSDHFEMTTSELRAANTAVSWEIGFRFQGTHFAYITSHVNAMTDLSPGRLHMDLSQRAALAAGQKKFDLMVPYDLHKESWCSAMVDANDYFLPLGLMGKIYGSIYLRNIRPIIRKIYYKLPQPALRILQTCSSILKQ
jgi:CelD/BcsL family acetyltransferase involved in cellulose biosynthesis